MIHLQAFLLKKTTQVTFSKRPWDKGFSLIELVVVIAVLAVLTAIALPNFLGVSDDASARTAQQAALNAFKECKVYWAKNKRDGTDTANDVVREFNSPSVTDWLVASSVSTMTIDTAQSTYAGGAQGKNGVGNDSVACFGNGGVQRNIWAIPQDTSKFPTFGILVDGQRICKTGSVKTGASKDTYNIGCDADDINTSSVWE